MSARRRLLYFLRRSHHDADLRDEIEAHRAHRQDALERAGLAPDAAARASRRAMGNVTLAVEDVRDVWVMRTLDSLRQDLRDAVRGLRKSPALPPWPSARWPSALARTQRFSRFSTA